MLIEEGSSVVQLALVKKVKIRPINQDSMKVGEELVKEPILEGADYQ